MVKFEWPKANSAPAAPERVYHALAKYEGLERALSAHANEYLSSHANDEQPTYSMEQIAALIAHDKQAIAEAREFLEQGYEVFKDQEQADNRREQLAWTLVDLLSAPSK